MIGLCLHRHETNNYIPLQKHWTAVDEERLARLQVWGLPPFALLVLLGVPLEGSRHVDFRAIHQWNEDEKRRLGMIHELGGVQDFGSEQQWGPSQAGAFNRLASGIDVHHQSAVNTSQAEAIHSVGSNNGALHRGTEAPYRLQENVSASLGMTNVSGGIEEEDFGPAYQGSPPQEERSQRAGNGSKRPRDTEEIHGLGGFDNFGTKEMKKLAKESKKLSKKMKKLQRDAIQILGILEDSDLDSEASVT
ncbi:uncharacterized protein FTJAE_8378 [Fusarium tjaetaba]|uniref:Uncharacterized protein n=1 Tax=Fusarium tjaetaba TaxID=1567544 RepID=A0A8H5RBJ1_9HYPO|nr:uncharacterized protein FTJAE_8378 [Fusarium tjaetaba]KAF5630008.1 hypothetical protein FTJAE_8378 [Fusarium tjaetaba]